MRTPPLLLLAATTLLGLPQLTPDQVARFRGVSSPAISPDGTLVAYALSIPDPARNRTVTEIWVATFEGRSPRKLVSGSSPAWSPDGRRLAYLDAQYQAAAIDLSTGKTQALSRHAQPLLSFSWAPDGAKIAFLSLDPPKDRTAPAVIDQTDQRMHRLWFVDLASGQEKLLTPGNYSAGGYDQWFPDTYSWSPDSRSIAFSRRPHAKAGGHLYGDVAIASLDGQVRTLVAAEGMDGHPVWFPDGKSIAYLANHKYDWVLTSDLMVAPVAGGPARNITTEFDEAVKEFLFAPDGKRVFFTAGDRVANRFYAAGVDSGAVQPLTKDDSVFAQLSLSADGRRAAFIWQDSTTPPDVYATSVAEFLPVRISHANPEVDAWKTPRAEILRWKSFDGMEMEGIVHKPVSFAAGRRYPLLVIPHGGPHGVMTNGYPNREALLFLSRGWVVFRPNFRGSGNYGERFLRANLGGWGVGDYMDVMTGVDHVIAAGVADAERMAIAGSSYGGYMTSWAISQTGRFRAAVVGCAITDVPSFIRTTDVPERFEDYLGKDPAVYARHSPMAYGERIQTPALVWHGDQDVRVPLMQSRHLYTQMLKNQAPVEFVVYPGEGHGLRRPGFIRDLLERERAWLDRYVLGGGRAAP